MPDLWGPGAFGAEQPAAARPTFTPTNGSGDPDTWYQDCSSPTAADGTEWVSAAINILLAQLRGVVRSGSSVPVTNLDDLLLAKAMVSGHATYAVATGTANAWTVAPALAVPAYAAGRLLNVIAPASNTSTTVNMNVSGLGNRRIKKSDGSDPAIGDLQSGRVYPTIDDGTAIRIITPLPSETLAPPAGASTTRAPRLIGFTAGNSGQSVPTSTNTQITGLSVSQNNLFGSSTFSSNQLTVGAGEGGVWQLGGFSHFSAGAALGFVSMSVRVNGSQRVISGEGTTSDTAYADLSRPIVLAPGDVVTWFCSHQAGGTIGTLQHTVDAYLVSAIP